VVCVVWINKNHKIPIDLQKKIQDSKKLNHKRREEILKQIKKLKEISFVIYKLDNKKIDKLNILNATFEAFKMAVKKLEQNLKHKPDLILIDGNRIIKDLINYNQQAIIKGDNKVFSIALASIIAKEYRDSLMIKYAKKYPKYGFEINKGYGTRKHIEAIKKYGKCNIHRKSFLNNIYHEK